MTCFRLWCACLFVLLLPIAASAQTTILSANTVEFAPSADHAALRLDGSAVVTSYEFNAVATNPLGAIAITANLGKPVPAAGKIGPIVVSQLATITANLVYTAKVTAKGPDGNGVSPDSNPFGRATPQVPGPPGTPLVK